MDMMTLGAAMAYAKKTAEAAKPTVEELQTAVDNWLDDHPEATTTVEDGSITKAKLDSNLQGTVDEVPELKSAVAKIEVVDPSDLAQWLYAEDKYLNASYELTTLSGYNTYRIPVNQLDFVVIRWTGDYPFGTLNDSKLYAFEDNNGMRRDLTSVNYNKDNSGKKLGFIAPTNAVAIYFTLITSAIANNVMIVKNNAFAYSPNINYFGNFSIPINGSTAVDAGFYVDNIPAIHNWVNADYRTWWIKVKAGDTIAFAVSETELSANAYYVDSTGTRSTITNDTHTFSDDAVVTAFEKTDKTNNITFVQNSVKLKVAAQNVMGLGDAIDAKTAPIELEIDALDSRVDNIENLMDAADVSYTVGDSSGYYKYNSSTDKIDEASGSSFTRKKLNVSDWMKSVSFTVKSVTGLTASTTVFCGFTDEDDDFISRNDVSVGSYNMSIPSNAKYIYLAFYGSTYIDRYTITANTFIRQSEIDNLDIDNSFDGLTGVAFGTSLTYRSQTTGGFLNYLPELSGITFDNQGIGSSSIYGNMLTAIKGYTGYSGKRVCLLEGFVNDWYGNKTLGTWKDTAETSVCGCIRSALNYMLSQNANMTIFLILDPYGRDYNSVDCSSTAVNGSSLTQFEFYEEIAKVAESLGIPVIKEYAGSQISENTPQYFLDNIHPNALGAKQSANYIWSRMRWYKPNMIS